MIEIIKETQYLVFEEQPTKNKTKVIHVINRTHKDVIGVIKWYGSWRQYCFFPAYDTVWNTGCLNDVLDVINTLMKDRKRSK